MAEGITAWIADEHYIWANWSMSYALGGVKLQVRQNDKASALLVLSKLHDGNYECYLTEDENELVLAKCKARNGVTFSAINTLRAKFSQVILYLCFGFVLRIRASNKVCKQCGQVFKNEA